MDDALTDLAVIILVGNEERHIRRCLERLKPLRPRQVLVVESQTGDRTHAVAIATAKCLNWRIDECLNEDRTVPLFTSTSSLHLIFHPWPGLYAKQFNWALDYLGEGRSKSEEGRSVDGAPSWILRLDADEYLTEETCERLRSYIGTQTPSAYADVSTDLCAYARRNTGDGATASVEGSAQMIAVQGLTLELKRKFCGGEIRHATNGIRLLRLFRRGAGRCEERSMDEHIVLTSGAIEDFDGAFYDDNLNDMDWWREKHRGYAKREAADALAFARGELHFKREKEMYYRWPRYFRAVLYFLVRYVLKGGFLDGSAGWMWNFWQGLWYRWIVDREIGRGEVSARADGTRKREMTQIGSRRSGRASPTAA